MAGGRVDTTVFPVTNITSRVGYDNQPEFSSDGQALIYVSDRSGYSVDIWRHLFKRGQRVKLSYSDDVNEYSPSPRSPNGYWAILEEPGGVLRLWHLLGDALSGNPVLPDVKNVGYYAWSDETHVALFVVGPETTLQFADIESGSRRIVARSIGRSIHTIPGTNQISFVHKETEGKWTIKRFNPDTDKISEIAPVLGDGEDFAWTADGSLMMAGGKSVFRWDGGSHAWVPFADFSGSGLENISRLAFSPTSDKMAFVASTVEPAGTD